MWPEFITWRNFLTGADDRTISNVTFLSRPREWHALAIGVLGVLSPDLLLQMGAPSEFVAPLAAIGAGSYTLGRVVRRLAEGLEREMGSGLAQHFRDAMREPAYVAVGAGVALAVGHAYGIAVAAA